MIFGISYSRSNPRTVYFVTDTSQVWKSTDDGTSWSRKGNMPTNGISLTVSPTNENIVYVAGSNHSNWTEQPGTVEGIFRTTDGGETWQNLKQAHFHRSAQGGVHIAFAGNTIYAGPGAGGLLKSTDGGTVWTAVPKSGGGYVSDAVEITNVTVHPADNTILFVSTLDGLYKVVDSGTSATVTRVNGLPAGGAYRSQINPTNPNTMYVSVGSNGVYWSTDGGLNFSQRNNGLANPLRVCATGIWPCGGIVQHITMSPANPNRLVIAFKNLFGNFVYYTDDGGANWTQTSSMDEKTPTDGLAARCLVIISAAALTPLPIR